MFNWKTYTYYIYFGNLPTYFGVIMAPRFIFAQFQMYTMIYVWTDTATHVTIKITVWRNIMEVWQTPYKIKVFAVLRQSTRSIRICFFRLSQDLATFRILLLMNFGIKNFFAYFFILVLLFLYLFDVKDGL